MLSLYPALLLIWLSHSPSNTPGRWTSHLRSNRAILPYSFAQIPAAHVVYCCTVPTVVEGIWCTPNTPPKTKKKDRSFLLILVPIRLRSVYVALVSNSRPSFLGTRIRGCRMIPHYSRVTLSRSYLKPRRISNGLNAGLPRPCERKINQVRSGSLWSMTTDVQRARQMNPVFGARPDPRWYRRV